MPLYIYNCCFAIELLSPLMFSFAFAYLNIFSFFLNSFKNPAINAFKIHYCNIFFIKENFETWSLEVLSIETMKIMITNLIFSWLWCGFCVWVFVFSSSS